MLLHDLQKQFHLISAMNLARGILKMISLSCDPAVKTSIHSTWQRTSQYDIALISETQVVHSVQHKIRSHHLFSVPASAPNRHGEGLIIAVSKQLPYSASLWRKDS